MSKTLVIIGGGEEQIPAYQAAKRRGLIVVGTDLSADAPALALADHVILASTRDAAESVKRVVEFARSHPVGGVMTIANDVPYTVTAVAEALGLKSIGIEAARCASDKLLMKRRFQQYGVACPWFSPVDSIEHLNELTQDRDLQRYVLKPVDGRGARGVLLVDGETDLNWAFDESRRWGDSGQLILEKFISGLQLSTESYILDGHCYTPAISERNYSRLEQFLPYIIENGGTVPADLDVGQRCRIDRLLFEGAKAMGINEGIVKGDLVIGEDGEPMIIELAARLSGGWFATDQIPAATGVNLVDAVISYAIGEQVYREDLIPKFNTAVAIRYWFPEPGIIERITGEESLSQCPSVLKYGFFRKVGDVQLEVKMHPDRFGYVIVVADDRDEVLKEVEHVLGYLRIDIR